MKSKKIFGVYIGIIIEIVLGLVILIYIANLSIIYAIIFFLFIVSFIIFIFVKNRESRRNEKILKDKILELENIIDESISFVDPLEAGVTAAELVLLQTLCCYGESNIDIGLRLNKSSNTIKRQMVSLFDKIGVDTRCQLIEQCKNYFPKESTTLKE